ncbi:deoxycytidylate deaminase-like [Hyposmocoma kahamanoa]|uniref:deoxycytidylate deaminase-like n=1 Tax=Hyposmocoma kahamanoa TaxID=1477025 RepID=UPI000E6DA554|nr:deoxycytidylate deaminase-like [Hyposmocoma kahamanoa]XP_026317978.1 deoxycytidylate deaminase-like [Hyposmocoma kahamanoa]
MRIVSLAAERSKDPSTQVGACVVNNDKIIVSIGYNGMPIGCPDSKLSWEKKGGLEDRLLYVCHAEMNAIINKSSTSVKGCTLYVGLLPCEECAKVIIRSGITEVVYMKYHKKYKGSLPMLKDANIKHWKYPEIEEFNVYFDEDRPKVLYKM